MPKEHQESKNDWNRLPQRKHLRRLDAIFDRHRVPLFFMTLCVQGRSRVLGTDARHAILAEAWTKSGSLYGWLVGRYMTMPDHIHFFAAPQGDAALSQSQFISRWKRWTQSQIRHSCPGFEWQDEFFDHLLRSGESYGDKWEYVRQNPVRAGLVERPEDWPYQGEVHVLQW